MGFLFDICYHLRMTAKQNKTKAILVDLIHPRMLPKQSMERMAELEELVNTYGGIVVIKKYQRRFAPHPRTYIGTGKVEELAEEGPKLGAELVIVNDQLKPRQMYNISESLRKSKMQVWDRIDLILKIFAKHAHTTEAKLEIELASISHMGPRIYGMGMELSRQGGGIGTSGVGETNTEIMKRHLRARELSLREKLESCQTGRDLQRRNRKRRGLQTVAIVGYTNAGKTTLLNALTGRREYAANELFATLDTRIGSLYLPGKQKTVLVSDTIGFIRDLPPDLIKAFASTLSEAVAADLLVHVVDASDKNVFQHVRVVEDVLEKLHALATPRLIVLNKTDAVSKAVVRRVRGLMPSEIPTVAVSAATGEGIAELVLKIEQSLADG